MATIRRAIALDAAAGAVWDAVRDFGNVHKRLAPGFVIECEAEQDGEGGIVRQVTFFNGLQAREYLVTCDDAARRLAYGARGGRASHYNAVVEVIAEHPGSRLVWTIDLLPDALAGPIGAMVEQAAAIMKRTLDQP